jgi:hypothetical protein
MGMCTYLLWAVVICKGEARAGQAEALSCQVIVGAGGVQDVLECVSV